MSKRKIDHLDFALIKDPLLNIIFRFLSLSEIINLSLINKELNEILEEEETFVILAEMFFWKDQLSYFRKIFKMRSKDLFKHLFLKHRDALNRIGYEHVKEYELLVPRKVNRSYGHCIARMSFFRDGEYQSTPIIEQEPTPILTGTYGRVYYGGINNQFQMHGKGVLYSLVSEREGMWSNGTPTGDEVAYYFSCHGIIRVNWRLGIEFLSEDGFAFYYEQIDYMPGHGYMFGLSKHGTLVDLRGTSFAVNYEKEVREIEDKVFLKNGKEFVYSMKDILEMVRPIVVDIFGYFPCRARPLEIEIGTRLPFFKE